MSPAPESRDPDEQAIKRILFDSFGIESQVERIFQIDKTQREHR